MTWAYMDGNIITKRQICLCTQMRNHDMLKRVCIVAVIVYFMPQSNQILRVCRISATLITKAHPNHYKPTNGQNAGVVHKPPANWFARWRPERRIISRIRRCVKIFQSEWNIYTIKPYRHRRIKSIQRWSQWCKQCWFVNHMLMCLHWSLLLARHGLVPWLWLHPPTHPPLSFVLTRCGPQLYTSYLWRWFGCLRNFELSLLLRLGGLDGERS